jgi:hypothetical protein
MRLQPTETHTLIMLFCTLWICRVDWYVRRTCLYFRFTLCRVTLTYWNTNVRPTLHPKTAAATHEHTIQRAPQHLHIRTLTYE